MSDDASSKSVVIRVVHTFVWITVVIVVSGLQFLLPWISYNTAGESLRQIDGYVGNSFWNRRLRFEAFLRPEYIHEPEFCIGSVAVCKDELIVLLGYPGPWRTVELVHMNLKTGRMTKSAVLPNVRHVLSDGETIWYVTEDDLDVGRPFIWQGRPVAMQQRQSLAGYFQFREFIEGQWQPADLYALLPDQPTACSFDWRSDGSRSLFCAVTNDDDLWYRTGVELGTEDQIKSLRAKYFASEWNRNPPFRQGVWNYVHRPEPDIRWPNVISPTACANEIFERDGLSILGYDGGDTNYERAGLAWRHYPGEQSAEPKFVPLPIRWTNQVNAANCPQIAHSADGRTYIVFCSGSDRRWLILEWNYGQLRLVFHQSDPRVWLICLDGAWFFGLAVMIPMLALSFITVSWQKSPRFFSFGSDTVVLASVIRRGTARTIDLFLVIAPLTLSITCHPDFVEWWRELARAVQYLIIEFWPFAESLDWSLLLYLSESSSAVFSAFMTVSVRWWLFGIALLIGIAQLIWQARCGRTVGKWICGLKVVRTTLRPCGVARSILRELLLVIDSACLQSWIPGVISILKTKHSQRIGDRLADTIVIRESEATPSPLRRWINGFCTRIRRLSTTR